MRESYGKGLANHPGPELCGGGGDTAAEALVGENVGRVPDSSDGLLVPVFTRHKLSD